MTTYRSYLSVLIVVAVAAGLAGCTGLVQVVDPDGRPVPRALVTAVALEAVAGPSVTNGQGEAHLPISLHEVKWVQVAKPWHRTIQVDVPDSWPLRVVLEPTPGCPNP
jgi:hypothetical protein